VLRFRNVKKILVVLLVGGLALALFLGYLRRETPANVAATAAAPTTASPATAAAAQVTAPAAAPASAPPVAGSGASDAAACERLADLCSTSDQKVDVSECEKQLSDAHKMAGAGNVARSEQCIADARTCAAATGCISGGVGMGAMGEFLKGFGSALSN
jgi:hypothetical protein